MVSEPHTAHSTRLSLLMADSGSSSASAPFNLPNIAQLVAIKLDGTNFLAWMAQFLPIFCSYDLMGIVDGSNPCPPKFIDVEHEKQGLLNSAYVVWQRKDQMILSWLISSLTPSLVATMYGINTSCLAWQSLTSRFSAQSKSRISLIKWQLQTIKQGDKSCRDFVAKAKLLADQLSAVGKPVDDDELITYIATGLQNQFHHFVTSYTLVTREKGMSFDDFQAELLNYDLMLTAHNSQAIQPESGSYALYSKGQSKPNYRNNRPRSMLTSTTPFTSPMPHLAHQQTAPLARESFTNASTTRSRSPC